MCNLGSRCSVSCMKNALANIQAVALVFFLVPSAFGQAQKSDYPIHGTVRNTVTGEPVKNALVSLEWTPTDPSNSSPDRESSDQSNVIWIRRRISLRRSIGRTIHL